jgi:hypothetical protein
MFHSLEAGSEKMESGVCPNFGFRKEGKNSIWRKGKIIGKYLVGVLLTWWMRDWVQAGEVLGRVIGRSRKS